MCHDRLFPCHFLNSPSRSSVTTISDQPQVATSPAKPLLYTT